MPRFSNGRLFLSIRSTWMWHVGANFDHGTGMSFDFMGKRFSMCTTTTTKLPSNPTLTEQRSLCSDDAQLGNVTPLLLIYSHIPIAMWSSHMFLSRKIVWLRSSQTILGSSLYKIRIQCSWFGWSYIHKQTLEHFFVWGMVSWWGWWSGEVVGWRILIHPSWLNFSSLFSFLFCVLDKLRGSICSPPSIVVRRETRCNDQENYIVKLRSWFMVICPTSTIGRKTAW